MLKKLVFAGVMTAMLAAPFVVAAQTSSASSSESSLIAQLTQLVQVLEQELQTLLSASGSQSTSANVQTSTASETTSSQTQGCPAGTTGTYPDCLLGSLTPLLSGSQTDTNTYSDVSGDCPAGDVYSGGACISVSLSPSGQAITESSVLGSNVNGNGNGQVEINQDVSAEDASSSDDTDVYQNLMPINPCGNSHSYGPAWGDCQECPNGTIATPDGSSCVPACPAGSVGTPPNCTNECGLPVPICPTGFVNTGGICGQLCDRTAGYILGDPELIVGGFYGPPPLDISLDDDGAYGTITINFGDGTAPYTTTVTCNGPCSFPSVTHFYQTPGTYTATLMGEQTQGGPVVLIGTASIFVFNPANPSTCPTGTQGIFPICYGGSPVAPSLPLDLSNVPTTGTPTLTFTVNGQSSVTLTPGTSFLAEYSSSNAIGCAGTTVIGSTVYPLGGIATNEAGAINGSTPTTGSEIYVISCTGGDGQTVTATTTITASNTSVANLDQLASALDALESAVKSLF